MSKSLVKQLANQIPCSFRAKDHKEREMKYELYYIIKSNTSDEAKEQTIAKVNAFIEKCGGKIESSENQGNKKFAYEINKMREGTYVLTYFTAPTAAVATINRELNINENVIRHMIVAK